MSFIINYPALLPRLEQLRQDCGEYLATHKRWLNYFNYWRQGGRDPLANQLTEEMESLVIELSNSDNNLLLNKLMDFPIISGYNQLSKKISHKVGLAIGIFIPLGLPLYLVATYQRKLLLHDIRIMQKTSGELMEMIEAMN